MITFAEMKKEILKTVFPVGSTYITQDDINPNNILNFGSWERVKGKVLIGLDENDSDFNQIGKIGGAKTHTLTVKQIPSHSHETKHFVVLDTAKGYNTWEKDIAQGDGGAYLASATTENAGGNQPFSIVQSYVVVGYVWRRTA